MDPRGLDALDRRLLTTIIEKFDGGPVGIESLAAAIGEERGTLEDVVEPFLIQRGLLARTARGRMATRTAYLHLGLQVPAARGQRPAAVRGRRAVTAGEFRWPIRVYYEDTDAGGVVYHTGYIRYFERARTEWLRALGYSQQRLVQEEGVLFTVVDLAIQLPASRRGSMICWRCVHARRGRAARRCCSSRQCMARMANCWPRARCAWPASMPQTFRPRRLPALLAARSHLMMQPLS